MVTCGFFPPQPHGMQCHERQDHQAQRQVPHQRHVTAALEVRQPDLGLRHPEQVLHVPADEGTYEEPTEGPTLPLDRQIEAVRLILVWLTGE